MKEIINTLIVLIVGVGCFPSTPKIDFKYNGEGKQIDVYVGTKYFTSLIYPDTITR